MDTSLSMKQLIDYTGLLIIIVTTVGISMANKQSFRGGMEVEDW